MCIQALRILRKLLMSLKKFWSCQRCFENRTEKYLLRLFFFLGGGGLSNMFQKTLKPPASCRPLCLHALQLTCMPSCLCRIAGCWHMTFSSLCFCSTVPCGELTSSHRPVCTCVYRSHRKKRNVLAWLVACPLRRPSALLCFRIKGASHGPY